MHNAQRKARGARLAKSAADADMHTPKHRTRKLSRVNLALTFYTFEFTPVNLQKYNPQLRIGVQKFLSDQKKKPFILTCKAVENKLCS